MAWAAQSIADPKLIPLGATDLARQPPLAKLGKLGARANRCVYLRKFTRTPRVAHAGKLTPNGKL